jgi:hypothetical protein
MVVLRVCLREALIKPLHFDGWTEERVSLAKFLVMVARAMDHFGCWCLTVFHRKPFFGPRRHYASEGSSRLRCW